MPVRQTHPMVIAVCKRWRPGFDAGGDADIEQLREELKTIREHTDKPSM